MTSRHSNEPSPESSTRKRVGKACDRCRLKKSKCDGASPCSRCRTDNAICMFGERKKSQDKVYPKGYVEMLEQHHTQLIAATRDMYKRLLDGGLWPGDPLADAHEGHPLTHDILERLDLLQPTTEGGSTYQPFEEDHGQMQKTLLERGAPYIDRRRSGSSDDHSSGGSSDSDATSLILGSSQNPFARTPQDPPTPTQPFPRNPMPMGPVKVEPPFSPTFTGDPTFDPTPLTFPLESGGWTDDVRYNIPPEHEQLFEHFGYPNMADYYGGPTGTGFQDYH